MMLGDFLEYLFVMISLLNLAHGNVAQNTNFTSSHLKDHIVTEQTQVNSAIESIKEISAVNVSKEDLTHHPRENIGTESTYNISSIQNNMPNIETTPQFIVPKKNDGKTIVGKKGVHFHISVDNTSMTLAIPLTSSTLAVNSTSKNDPLKIQKIDIAHEAPSKTYVVLIVASVFAMPLVALIFIGLYKVGSEWWQHRHYRRMDFLIEGIYNN